ncbi:hypothetical protein FVE85_1157 [Porphyridium purpureum]|uniref:Uncharacterized protein n=1 Tax=Porphyridium purpureum TaxID=35688 RepID=A0A5J4Z268_PORPP|nr:hypothetical protein FVE85_1157 [Porphyridium purpureum]|eukprot:POR5921..scf208_2
MTRVKEYLKYIWRKGVFGALRDLWKDHVALERSQYRSKLKIERYLQELQEAHGKRTIAIHFLDKKIKEAEALVRKKAAQAQQKETEKLMIGAMKMYADYTDEMEKVLAEHVKQGPAAQRTRTEDSQEMSDNKVDTKMKDSPGIRISQLDEESLSESGSSSAASPHKQKQKLHSGE